MTTASDPHVREIILAHREASGRTAIARNTWSTPCRWLFEKSGIFKYATGTTSSYTVLDYGCGKGADVMALIDRKVDAVGFDPVHAPEGAKGRTGSFDLVLCTYVLNTLPTAAERMFVIDGIVAALVPEGRAFVTVSRDFAAGWTRNSTYQNGAVDVARETAQAFEGRVNCVSIHKSKSFEIYMIGKSS